MPTNISRTISSLALKLKFGNSISLLSGNQLFVSSYTHMNGECTDSVELPIQSERIITMCRTEGPERQHSSHVKWFGCWNSFDYRPQCTCGKVMFLHVSVILTTGGGVWQAGTSHPHPRADTRPWAGTPSPGRQTPPPGTATATDGKHPTGMHSCYTCFPIYPPFKRIGCMSLNI